MSEHLPCPEFVSVFRRRRNFLLLQSLNLSEFLTRIRALEWSSDLLVFA
jgi:hypothetical protein